MSGWVRLTPAQRADLDEALEPFELDDDTAFMIEAHLTGYRDRHRPSNAPTPRDLATSARELLALMARASNDVTDLSGRDHEIFLRLTGRVQEWEAVRPTRPSTGRPASTARRDLLWRAVSVLDDAGFDDQGTGDAWKRSQHHEAPRVRALRVVDQIANVLDGRPRGKGSLRLIKSVLTKQKGTKAKSKR